MAKVTRTGVTKKMWGNRKKKTTRIDSLIGQQTEIKGDIVFSGGLHIDGKIEGNIAAQDDSASIFILSEQGSIKGEVRAPNIIINGTIIGNVYAEEHVELAPNACITGNVYYKLIEMAKGAEVNGNLVRSSEMENQSPLPPEHEKAKNSQSSNEKEERGILNKKIIPDIK